MITQNKKKCLVEIANSSKICEINFRKSVFLRKLYILSLINIEKVGDSMIQIRPVSDLQNDYNAIEKEILNGEQTMYLTKNGYGSMVMMSLEKYAKLTDETNGAITQENPEKKEHIEIISRPKRVVDDDDE